MNQKEIDPNKVLFRSSKVGLLMVGGNTFTESNEQKLKELQSRKEGTFLTPSGKKGGFSDKNKQELEELLLKKSQPFELGETAKSFVEEEWLRLKYGIKSPDLATKEIMKGKMCEQDSVRFLDQYYPSEVFRNTRAKRRKNDFFTGKCDATLDFSDTNTRVIEEYKTPYSISTFFRVREPHKLYKYQVQSYLDLYEADIATLLYVLVPTPEQLLQEEEMRFFYRYGADNENKQYIEACEGLRADHNIDSIPADQRVKKFIFTRDEESIKELKIRVEAARAYFATLTLDMISSK